jgi:hypothetical protein
MCCLLHENAFSLPCHYSNFLPDRIIKRIDPADCGCWIWVGQKSRNGYGRVWYKGANRAAHRVVWQMLIGEIPDGKLLDHVKQFCQYRECVNPAHLEPVTPKENTLRGNAVLFQSSAQYDCEF